MSTRTLSGSISKKLHIADEKKKSNRNPIPRTGLTRNTVLNSHLHWYKLINVMPGYDHNDMCIGPHIFGFLFSVLCM